MRGNTADPLVASLQRVRRRLALQQWIHFSIRSLWYSLSACVAAVVLVKLFPALGEPQFLCLALLALGLATAAGLAVRRRPRLVDAALEADRRLGLDERLTSSLALADREGGMYTALHADARRHLAQLDVVRAFPLVPPRSTRWLLVPLAAVVLASLMPELDVFQFRERQAEAKAREEARHLEAERLLEVVKPLKESELVEGDAADLAEFAQAVERVAEELKAGELTEKQALAKLTNLSEALESQREQLKQAAAVPQLSARLAEYGMARDLARTVQDGNFEKAVEEARRLQEKLEKGELTAEEKKKLAEALQKLSESMKGESGTQSQALQKALEKAAAGMGMEGLDPEALQQALDGLEALEMSLEDMASAMEQLEKLDAARLKLAQARQRMMGPSSYCRMCGAELSECPNGSKCTGCGEGMSCSGICGSCAGGDGYGPGMGNRGRGEGNTTGPLPDVNDGFEPTMLPGGMTPGQVIADIVQRTRPDGEDAEPTADFVSGAFIEVQQQAEQALTREEIPVGSKEYVRQYFGSLEPEAGADEHEGHDHGE